MSYLINVYDPKEWDIYADSTFYPVKPKKVQTLSKWAKDTDADIASNLCFFNFLSSKENPGYTIQYLRIPRLGGDCGYGSNSTPQLVTLPNGDRISGWSTVKKPAMMDGAIISANKTSRRAHNAIGTTTDNRYFVMQNNGNTEYEMCRKITSFLSKYYGTKVKLMLWEDGGGSVGTYCRRSQILYAPLKEGANGRAVASVICARRKANAPKITRTLKKGMTGDDVKLLQMMIGLEADGIFGNGTRTRVFLVQKGLTLTADGIAGPKTLTALGLY